MKKITFLLLILTTTILFSQTKKVLVYHETNGFRHSGAINNGIPMIENQGIANGLWATDDSQDSSVFNAANLAQYDAVVFLNTSGNDLLNTSERAAFENFITNGGGFVGVHAATDTYRDGSWPFYNELVGGIVQTNPNHTSNNFDGTMEVLNNHPAVNFLGGIWDKPEEYYYWELNGGQLSADNTVLLEVRSTGSNSYDVARPIAWFKEAITVGGTTFNNLRSFYTALGHNGGDYNGADESDIKFQSHIEEAITWSLRETLSVSTTSLSEFKIYPNPIQDLVTLEFRDLSETLTVDLYDILGKLVYREELMPSMLQGNSYPMDVSSLNSGIYILSLKGARVAKSMKLIKN